MKNWFLRRKPLFYVSIGVAVLFGSVTFYLFMFVDQFIRNSPNQVETALAMTFMMGVAGFALPLLVLKELRKRTRGSRQIGGIRRGWDEDEKRQVRRRQDGRCNKCGDSPPRWEYHHRDGNRSNNSLSNCEGLCPNCHSVKTHDD